MEIMYSVEKLNKDFKNSGYKRKIFICKKCKRRITYFTKNKKDMANRKYLYKKLCSPGCTGIVKDSNNYKEIIDNYTKGILKNEKNNS